jgi:hypothetical protein
MTGPLMVSVERWQRQQGRTESERTRLAPQRSVTPASYSLVSSGDAPLNDAGIAANIMAAIDEARANGASDEEIIAALREIVACRPRKKQHNIGGPEAPGD